MEPKDYNAEDKLLLGYVKRAKRGEHELFDRIYNILEPQIKTECSTRFIAGCENEDLLQLARISLWDAINDYDEAKESSFRYFAVKICIRRKLFTEISKQKRHKARALNNYTSLDTPVISSSGGDSSQTIMDFLVDEGSDFTRTILYRDAKDHVREILNRELTELEATVLEGYEQDKPYKDIARELGVDDKCVDNSLARIRNKVLRLCQDNEFAEDLEEDVLSSIIYRSSRKGRSRD